MSCSVIAQRSARVLLLKCDSFISHPRQKNICNLLSYVLSARLLVHTPSVRKCVDSASPLFKPQERSLPPDQLLILASSCLCSCRRVCLIHHIFFPLCLISFLLLKALSFPSGDDEIHFEACALLSLGSCSQASRCSRHAASTMASSSHLSPSESRIQRTAFDRPPAMNGTPRLPV